MSCKSSFILGRSLPDAGTKPIPFSDNLFITSEFIFGTLLYIEAAVPSRKVPSKSETISFTHLSSVTTPFSKYVFIYP